MTPKNVTIQALTLVILLSGNAFASGKKPGMVAAKNGSMAKLSTDIHFDGVNVNGRRQSPFGASAVVENEKKTPNLIDYRNNYDDRIRRSRSGR